MMRLLFLSLFAFLVISQPVIAQTFKVEDLRILTGFPLERLSYFVISGEPDYAKILTTTELKNRLGLVPQTRSILITNPTNGVKDIAWYTDSASSRPKAFGEEITRDEHTLLYELSESTVFAMYAGPKTVTERVVIKQPDGTQVSVPVMKTIVVTPTEAEVKAAVADLAKVKNENVRATLELVAGAKFAELFPPNTTLTAPKQAIILADKYRKVVYENAVKLYAAKSASQLPPLYEPVLFGKMDNDLLSVARAVQGAEPVATFETEGGKFAAVWDKSTLILVRQPKGFGFPTSDNKLQLSDSWIKSLDPKNKEPFIKSDNLKMFPDFFKPLVIPKKGPNK